MLERWLSGQEYVLVFQRIWVWLPASTWLFTNVRGIQYPLLASVEPGTNVVHRYRYKKTIHIHKWTVKYWMCISSKQTKSLPWEGEVDKVTPLTKKLFVIDACWERENQWSATGSINHSPEQTPYPGVVGQHKTDSSFYFVGLFVMFLFWYLCLTRFCLFFIFLPFVSESEWEYEVVWEGRWGGVREGEEYDQYIVCEKIK